jgi:ABC-type uncharacterized transport system involved in gliding motility auxiliary subunit
LREGGNLIIAAQAYNYDYSQDYGGMTISARRNETGLDRLLEDYGVKLSDGLLMDQKQEVLNINQQGAFGPFAVSVPVKAPMHILVDQDTMNQELSITGRLSPLFYLWGSSLDLDKDKITKAALKQTVLFSSSRESWKVPYKPGALSPGDVEHAGGYDGNFPLAVLLQGQFPDHYSGQAPPPWPRAEAAGDAAPPSAAQAEPVEAAPVLSPRAGKLLVIGCSTMFEENIIKSGGALNLFMNAVDALTLGEALIGIRSHQPVDRTVRKTGAMEKLWYRFLVIVLVPALVVALGGVRAIMRRKEKELYLQAIACKTE